MVVDPIKNARKNRGKLPKVGVSNVVLIYFLHWKKREVRYGLKYENLDVIYFLIMILKLGFCISLFPGGSFA